MLTTLLLSSLLYVTSATGTVENTLPVAFIEMPAVGTAAAAIAALVAVWETLNIPPRLVLLVALTLGVFVGGAVVAGFIVALQQRQRR